MQMYCRTRMETGRGGAAMDDDMSQRPTGPEDAERRNKMVEPGYTRKAR